ncbi:MAG: hypothetical protein ACK5LC_11650 [Coprobacillaceae bacterium]
MTNTVLLEKKIRESGIKKSVILERLNLSYQGLSNKIKGKTAFKAYEISEICDILKLSKIDKESIFFASK